MNEIKLDDIQIEPLSKKHDRAAFDCGEASLNEFLKRFALQNQEIDYSRSFVACLKSIPSQMAGYYTISSGALDRKSLPDTLRKHTPRYPVPVAHIGRLAVDIHARGIRLGETLLMHALQRSERLASEELGLRGVEVWALNESAKHFYLNYGFVGLLDNAFHLYLPIAVVREILKLR